MKCLNKRSYLTLVQSLLHWSLISVWNKNFFKEYPLTSKVIVFCVSHVAHGCFFSSNLCHVGSSFHKICQTSELEHFGLWEERKFHFRLELNFWRWMELKEFLCIVFRFWYFVNSIPLNSFFFCIFFKCHKNLEISLVHNSCVSSTQNGLNKTPIQSGYTSGHFHIYTRISWASFSENFMSLFSVLEIKGSRSIIMKNKHIYKCYFRLQN